MMVVYNTYLASHFSSPVLLREIEISSIYWWYISDDSYICCLVSTTHSCGLQSASKLFTTPGAWRITLTATTKKTATKIWAPRTVLAVTICCLPHRIRYLPIDLNDSMKTRFNLESLDEIDLRFCSRKVDQETKLGSINYSEFLTVS